MRTVFLFLLNLFLLIFFYPEAWSAPAPFSGNTLFFGGRQIKDLTMPAVAFDHSFHSQKNSCQSCHDTGKGEGAKATFHIFSGLGDQAKAVDMHRACRSCHAEKGGPAVAQCRKCHRVNDPGVLPGEATHSPHMDTTLHQRHLMSGYLQTMPPADGKGILHESASGRCVVCHHAVSGREDNRPDSCRACHAGGPGTGLSAPEGTNPPPLRVAAHTTCVKCHFSLNEKKEAHGPFDCAGCHSQKDADNLPSFAVNPSFITMDRPTGVLLTGRSTQKEGGNPATSASGASQNGSMPPVPFDHSAHERSVDCAVCHHNSIRQSCITCHTPQGDSKGKNITFAQAMHSRASGHSCVSCHASLTARYTECRGCHTQHTAAGENCAFCHRTTDRPIEKEKPVAIGAAPAQRHINSIPDVVLSPKAILREVPELSPVPSPHLAPSAILMQPDPVKPSSLVKEDSPAARTEVVQTETETVGPIEITPAEPLLPAVKKTMPATVEISSMSREYHAVKFPHDTHMKKLRAGIVLRSPALAGVHSRNSLECMACHHHSPPITEETTPPACGSCHPNHQNTDKDRPSLKVAYHQRCMDCHTRMGLEKPKASDCQSCHRKKNEK